jgi:phage-related protein
MVTMLVNDVIPQVIAFGSTVGEKLKPYIDDLIFIFKEYLIPYFQFWWEFISGTLIPGIVDTFAPILEGLFKAFGYIADAIQKNSDKLAPFFTLLKNIASFILNTLAPIIGEVLGAALKVIGIAISTVIGLFANLVNIINGAVNAIKSLISIVASNPLVRGIGSVIDNVFGGGRAAGGTVMAGTSYLVGEKGPEIFTPSGSGMITPNNKLGGGNTVINLNVSGAIDPEGTARTIINVLNNSYYRGTSGATALVF